MRKELRQFSVNLRRLRIERGMSQSHLASLLGVDKSYISRLETGSKNPTLSTIAELANVLQTHIGKLVS